MLVEWIEIHYNNNVWVSFGIFLKLQLIHDKEKSSTLGRPTAGGTDTDGRPEWVKYKSWYIQIVTSIFAFEVHREIEQTIFW